MTGNRAGPAQAVIGDQLRKLTAWCQIGSCIARYTDGNALGEVDLVALAVAAGWCHDAFGRLVCPDCQQRQPLWSARPLVPTERGDLAHVGRVPPPGPSRGTP
ncbi:MAG TPA: hypothetical protein VFQ44_02890 [Streptosporangiaceae bacterium]|nr:hypothetical protein [Streptosporangiaceae bacterium]